MKRRVLSFVFLAIVFCCYAKNDFHFAILGDRTGGANQAAFEIVVQEISSLRPDMIINVGDFIDSGNILMKKFRVGFLVELCEMPV